VRLLIRKKRFTLSIHSTQRKDIRRSRVCLQTDRARIVPIPISPARTKFEPGDPRNAFRARRSHARAHLYLSPLGSLHLRPPASSAGVKYLQEKRDFYTVSKTLAFGTCKLCHEERQLQLSDYMPAALYPKRMKLQYVTPEKSGIIAERMRARVLCLSCERRFNREGESEVLRDIAPKSLKRFPLHEKLRLALPRPR
jgi:hypothetical protein